MCDSAPAFHEGKSCKECSSGIPVSENVRSAYCSQECRAEAARRQSREHQRKKVVDSLLKPLTCAWCNSEFYRDTSGPGRGRFRRYCSESCSKAYDTQRVADYRKTEEWKEWYQSRVDSGHYKRKSQERREADPKPVHNGECEYCGTSTSWIGTQKRRRTCDSEVCKSRYALDRGHMRRVKIRDTAIEFVSRVEIFERDEWTCQLCLRPIDRSAVWPDKGSPVIDHVLPISKGGAHVKENIQTAHAHCNAVKSNRTEDEIAGMFGQALREPVL